MNEPKKPTPIQEEILIGHGHEPNDYCFLFETDLHTVFMRKDSGKKLRIEKE